MKHATMKMATAAMAIALTLTACGGTKSGNGEPSGSSPAQSASPTASASSTAGSALEEAYAGKYKGTTVKLFGTFTDEDATKFEQTFKPFTEKTGIAVQYEGSKEFETTISIRVDGGNAPDIASFSQPGLVASFAKSGKVVDIGQFLKEEELKKSYKQSWLDMATMDGVSGKIMGGVWYRTNAKSLVWYPKKKFEEAGYVVPQTWDEMIALSEQIVEDGDAPWTIGIGSGAATGWTATDWVEDIMLRTTSLDNYDKWVKGELPFTSDIVKNAVAKMADIWMNDKYVYGGTKSIATTFFGDAPKPMFDNPPKAWMNRQASFISGFFPQVDKSEYGFFYLPPIDPQYGKPVLVGGEMLAMFNDRPEVRALMEYFTKGESMKPWIQSGGAVAPHNDADISWYADDIDRGVAEIIASADSVRFDGSDMMPASVGAGTFWKGMTDYVSGTVELDQALEEIQAGWQKN